MTLTLCLPVRENDAWALKPYTMLAGIPATPTQRPRFNRIAYSAAHVVANPLESRDPWLDCALDWDATIAYRVHLWNLGLGVAEAMDTAQRGAGLDWPTSLQLIRESIGAARGIAGARLASGCGTDQLSPDAPCSLDDVLRAYESQMSAIEAAGGRLILMASRALARIARGPEDYARVYDRLLSAAREPVILHWLGDMFDPALAGYWGTRDIGAAMDVALDVIRRHAPRIDGIKISLLDKEHEIRMRRLLPPGVHMYTGDDFNFAELIAGDSQGYSHALLGIFDAIAPAAASALAALARDDGVEFHRILAPTVPLSRLMFAAPTRFYKTGVVFMAWLNGFQDHFAMVGGQQSARSIAHLSEIFRLADQAALLRDPALACHRMKLLLAVHGVG